MTTAHDHGAYSARVKMRLIVNGSSISVTQMGSDFLLIKPSEDHPPCQGTLILQVDENERRWHVTLPEGVSKSSKRVALGLCE